MRLARPKQKQNRGERGGPQVAPNRVPSSAERTFLARRSRNHAPQENPDNEMNGPLCWIGGKSFAARTIIGCFPTHVCYVEPFCGGAQCFFRKDRSNVEVLNDLDSELVNFYRCVQLWPMRVARLVCAMPHSRALFMELLAEPPCSRGPLARAARTWYLQKTSFAGKVAGQSFGYSRQRPERSTPEHIVKNLLAAAERLHQVTLECLPWQDVLKRYDSPETLFYCDPPYVGLPYYRHNLKDSDHRDLAGMLAKLRGTFVLSYNDHPLIRKLYEENY
jgi:DNA adenine methylase